VATDLTATLVKWYRPRRRAYPWRGPRVGAYRILVSEVMLQQTPASRVRPAFLEFVSRYPSLRALAAAPRGDVLRAWGSLGYPRRALALSASARAIVEHNAGRVPPDVDELQRLPGIGPYTAAAIACFAYGERVPAIDTNVARVVARARLGLDPREVSVRDVDRAARAWLEQAGGLGVRREPVEPATWNQAVMDLGREVCRPSPRCGSCPLARGCTFRRAGRTSTSGHRRHAPFEGSTRQVRGKVLRVLREGTGATSLGRLAAQAGLPRERIAAAVTTLDRDGLVRAGPAALAGRSRGRVDLPRD
jgi:A/G-specific adenine glycosylase